MPMRITFALSAIFLASGCSAVVPAPTQPSPQTPVSTPKPAPTPPPASTPPSAPQPLRGDWTEWPLANGDWTYQAGNRGSTASFGPPDGQASFTIRCDKSRQQLILSRAGAVANSGAQMTLMASSGQQTYPARNTGSQPSYAAISLSATEYMMDRIAFSRGRFAVRTTGLPPLAIPIWPEFTRVVEDCR
ncbi:hypothetical protein AB1K62_05905 [Parasphingorhabdus sp. JC815]|uniref:hypothetical protein n=1 Tax=Parasphingorhabdus sp. JC815 TaxID=3232140 RepID=UPI003457AE4A